MNCIVCSSYSFSVYYTFDDTSIFCPYFLFLFYEIVFVIIIILLLSQLHRIEIKNKDKISKYHQKNNKLKRICEKKHKKIVILKKTVAELEGKNLQCGGISHWHSVYEIAPV